MDQTAESARYDRGGVLQVQKMHLMASRSVGMLVALGVAAVMITPQVGFLGIQASEATAAGLWQQTDARTRKPIAWYLISEEGEQFNGKLVKLFGASPESKSLLCNKCEGEQKGAPLLGLTVIKSMLRDGLDYGGGTLLDPLSGVKYFGELHLSSNGESLYVRSYLGDNPFAGSERWTRLPESAAKEIAPALRPRRGPNAERSNAAEVARAPTPQVATPGLQQ